MRDRGLTVIKWPEQEIYPPEATSNFVYINDFSESEPSDDEREEDFPNSSRLNDFQSIHQWDPDIGQEQNSLEAIRKWEDDWIAYHRDKGLKIYRTRIQDIRGAVNNGVNIRGWPPIPGSSLPKIKGVLRNRLIARRHRAKQARENRRNTAQDPLHVDVPNLKDQYKAWTVTIDVSVDGNGMNYERYNVPPEVETDDPIQEYRWFGAEVVSPVLGINDERAKQAVRDACGALRDKLRIHKPMEVSSGLHVHLGHTKGWILPQLKVGLISLSLLCKQSFLLNAMLTLYASAENGSAVVPHGEYHPPFAQGRPRSR
jgi:hypothetical protein